MIKILIFLLTLNVFAVDLDECMQQADQYSVQSSINPLCFDLVKKEVISPKLKYISAKIEVYAHKNLLLIKHILKDSNKKYMISGKASKLDDILQVGFHDEDVFVLNKAEKGNELLVFRSKSHGPVGPSRLIDNEIVNSARRFQINERGLFFLSGNLSGNGQKIINYSNAGDSRLPASKPVKGNEISTEQLNDIYIQDFSFVGDNLFVITSDSSKPLKIFDKDKNLVQSASLDSLGMDSLRWIDFVDGNEYFLYDAEAKKYSFEIN